MDNAANEQDLPELSKPRSRLLAMKDRLRSQRNKQQHQSGSNLFSVSFNAPAKAPVIDHTQTSQSFSEATPTRKKSFFSALRHPKSKSTEIVLSKTMDSSEKSDLKKKDKKKAESSKKKNKSEEKRFIKLSKSKSFDKLKDHEPREPGHVLNKSLDTGMRNNLAAPQNSQSMDSEQKEVKYQILRKIPSDSRFMQKTRSSRNRSPSVEYTLRRKIVRNESHKSGKADSRSAHSGESDTSGGHWAFDKSNNNSHSGNETVVYMGGGLKHDGGAYIRGGGTLPRASRSVESTRDSGAVKHRQATHSGGQLPNATQYPIVSHSNSYAVPTHQPFQQGAAIRSSVKSYPTTMQCNSNEHSGATYPCKSSYTKPSNVNYHADNVQVVPNYAYHDENCRVHTNTAGASAPASNSYKLNECKTYTSQSGCRSNHVVNNVPSARSNAHVSRPSSSHSAPDARHANRESTGRSCAWNSNATAVMESGYDDNTVANEGKNRHSVAEDNANAARRGVSIKQSRSLQNIAQVAEWEDFLSAEQIDGLEQRPVAPAIEGTAMYETAAKSHAFSKQRPNAYRDYVTESRNQIRVPSGSMDTSYDQRIEMLRSEFKHLLSKGEDECNTLNRTQNKYGISPQNTSNDYEGVYNVRKESGVSVDDSDVRFLKEHRSHRGDNSLSTFHPIRDVIVTQSSHEPQASHVTRTRPSHQGENRPTLPPKSALVQKAAKAKNVSKHKRGFSERPTGNCDAVAGGKCDAVAGDKCDAIAGGKLKLRKPPLPRRHTVTVGAEALDTQQGLVASKKREFLDHLANKYPEHAQSITSTQQGLVDSKKRELFKHIADQFLHAQSIAGTQQEQPCATARPLPTATRDDSYYEAIHNEEDRLSTHSECDSGQFSRGGRLRASLPIVRSPNKSLEKPLGLVFLVFRSETKRSLLPNELTTVDTVRALFARAFSSAVSMQWFEHTHAKVYIQDPRTNVYYELEDLRDVKDRCVLKIVENEGIYNAPGEPQAPALPPGAHIQHALSPTVPQHSAFMKPPSAPVYARPHSAYAADSCVRSAPPSLIPAPARQTHEQTTSLSMQTHDTYQPQMALYAVPHQWPSPRLSREVQRYTQNPADTVSRQSYHEVTDQRTSGTATPVDDPATRSRMERMEAQLASLTVMVQHAVTSRPNSAHSECSQTSKTTTESGGSGSATPILPSPSCETLKGFEGAVIPALNPQMISSLRQMYANIQQLRADAHVIRQMQSAHMQTTKDAMNHAFLNIKSVMEKVPGAGDYPIRGQRLDADKQLHDYRSQADSMQNDLSDLSFAVEELRHDVLERGCRVNKEEVQTMALALGNISKHLAQLKGRFPDLQSNMKAVMAGEMEVVVKEEKLASVQEKQPVRRPLLGSDDCLSADTPRTSILSNIQALVPDHSHRIASLQEASEARARKKKIVVRGESLRFEKSLELAQKQLKSINVEQSEETSADSGLEKGDDLSKSEGGGGFPSHNEVPPQKPPRLFTAEPNLVVESRDSSLNNSAQTDHSTSRLSTFSTDLFSSTPNGQDLSSAVTSVTSPLSERSSFIGETSRVSESSAAGVKSATKPKKIPPPPPPRKSSRSTVRSGDKQYSPVQKDPDVPFSPPTYENIQKFSKQSSGILKSPSRIARPVVFKRVNCDDSFERVRTNLNTSDTSATNVSATRGHLSTSDTKNESATRGRPLSETDSDSSAHSQDTIKRSAKASPASQHSPLSPTRPPVLSKPTHSNIGVYNGNTAAKAKHTVNIQQQAIHSDFTETDIY